MKYFNFMLFKACTLLTLEWFYVGEENVKGEDSKPAAPAPEVIFLRHDIFHRKISSTRVVPALPFLIWHVIK